MFETKNTEWRQICYEAMFEVEPDRRMAILEKLGRILGRNKHKYGPLWVDFGRAQVKRNGSPVYLTNVELRLLRYLIERAGTLVSRDELLRSVWGYNSGAFTRTVDMHIHGLRQKLEQDAKRPELIVTVKGVGYGFGKSLIARRLQELGLNKAEVEMPFVEAQGDATRCRLGEYDTARGNWW